MRQYSFGRYGEAIEVYQKAIRINPEYADAYYDLGVAYLKAKDRSMALKQYGILKNLDTRKAEELLGLIKKYYKKSDI
jgi:tetratricopeptide (TPR) repeat protein